MKRWKFASIAFLALYILLIPIFGLLYNLLLPNDFYAPYAHFEPLFKEKMWAARNPISDAIKRSADVGDNSRKTLSASDIDLLKIGPSGYAGQKFIINSASASVFDSGDGKEFSIIVILSPQSEDANSGTCCALNLSGRFVSGVDAVALWSGLHTSGLLILKPSQYGFKSAMGEALFRSIGTPGPSPDEQLIALDSTEWTSLQDLLNEWNGVSRAIGRDLLRMMYFSSVTVTTLGYGDIVPLTQKARSAVVVEACSGVLLVGLFFFSLANYVAEGSSKSGEKKILDLTERACSEAIEKVLSRHEAALAGKRVIDLQTPQAVAPGQTPLRPTEATEQKAS